MFHPWRNHFVPNPNRRARRRQRRSSRFQSLEARSLLSVTPVGLTLTPTEGSAFTTTVATFTTTDEGPFTASIDWGDGTTTDGAIISGGETFSVTGTHTYADEGDDTISVLITDSADSTTATATSSVRVAEGDFGSLVPQAISATEGTAFNGVVGNFSDDGDPAQVAGDFTAMIDWGDGATTSGTVTGGNGMFTINGQHTYADEGTFTVIASFSDDAPSIITNIPITSTATVAEADALMPSGDASVHATEGVTFNGAVATFTDTGYPDNDASDLTATIDWGDGTTTSGSVSGSDGVFTVSGQHLYGSDLSYPLVVTLADDAPGTASATATGDADVADNDTLVPSAPLTLAATEGVTFTGVVATFTDTTYPTNTPDDFISWIDWGDGTTTSGTVSGSPGSFTVSGSHVYSEEGTQTATIELNDDTPDTASADATAIINIADAALTASGVTVAPIEGASFSGIVAGFTDTDPNGAVADFNATIDWGDGTTTTGTISDNGRGGFNVTGTHTYAEQGTNGITVAISDVGGSTVQVFSTAEVDDAPLSATAVAVTSPEFSTFTGVVATFTDADPNGAISDYTAMIDWGDGSSATVGSITAATGGGFQITGSHAYAEDGAYTVTVTIRDMSVPMLPPLGMPIIGLPIVGGFAPDDGAPDLVDNMFLGGGSTAVVTGTANITEPPISVSPVTFTGHERLPLVNIPVATFQHGNGAEPASGFTATIFWGDGTSSAGSIVQSGTTYTVLGSHVYLDEGAMPLLVQINDDTASATVVTSGRLFEELLPNGSVGTANERFIAEVYRDLLHRQVDKTALPYWSNMLDQGQSRLQVVQAIIGTAMPGELGVDLVQGMFEKYLGRDVDAAGLAFWMNILNFHETLEQTESNLVATPEFFAKAGGTNDGYVTRLFELALGREPDATARANFDAALAAGMSREQVAEIIFGSNEYHAKTVAGYFESPDDGNDRFTSVTPFIDDLDFLDRPADATGLAEFTVAMDLGLTDQQVWADFLSSNEFFAKTA